MAEIFDVPDLPAPELPPEAPAPPECLESVLSRKRTGSGGGNRLSRVFRGDYNV
ncbi:hypothetical protein [Nostoc sp.]|uniref:hypothetical protein n=1 Tax=Nostoc sp. TaxID=1180 RepID=UPI002FF8C3A2